jgi:hypothetical protein
MEALKASKCCSFQNFLLLIKITKGRPESSNVCVSKSEEVREITQ